MKSFTGVILVNRLGQLFRVNLRYKSGRGLRKNLLVSDRGEVSLEPNLEEDRELGCRRGHAGTEGAPEADTPLRENEKDATDWHWREFRMGRRAVVNLIWRRMLLTE